MGAAFLSIAIAAGTAVVGRLAGPGDAVPIAFFGLWAAALVWLLDRLPADEAADADADTTADTNGDSDPETDADNVALPI